MKSYTDIDQSKKLAKVLPLESADMYYTPPLVKGHTAYIPHLKRRFPIDWDIEKAIPCWSLAALRNLLPPAIKPNKDSYLFESHNTFDNSWVYRYYNEDGASYLYCKNTNEVDACVAMIIKLHEQKLL